MNNKISKTKAFKNLISVFLIIFHFIPFYIIISLSFKAMGDQSSHWIFPFGRMTLEPYYYALERGNLGRSLINTLIITSVAVILITVIGSMASYPLARIKTKTNKWLLSLIVGVMMVPPLSVLVPIYKEMIFLGGVNTYWGIILLNTTYNLPLSIFMYTNFVKVFPVELDEAALLDGCSYFGIFPRIILPNLTPVMVSVFILSGINIWNDYSFQLYMLQKPKLRTITLAVSSFFSERASYLPAAAATTVLATFPVAIIYLVLQKYFIKGTVDSAIK